MSLSFICLVIDSFICLCIYSFIYTFFHAYFLFQHIYVPSGYLLSLHAQSLGITGAFGSGLQNVKNFSMSFPFLNFQVLAGKCLSMSYYSV